METNQTGVKVVERTLNLDEITIDPSSKGDIFETVGLTKESYKEVAYKVKEALVETMEQPGDTFTNKEVIARIWSKLSAREVAAYAVKAIDQHINCIKGRCEEQEDDMPAELSGLLSALGRSGKNVHVIKMGGRRG